MFSSHLCSLHWLCPSSQAVVLLRVWVVCLGGGWPSPPATNRKSFIKKTGWASNKQERLANLEYLWPACSLPATTPRQTWQEMFLQCLGKGLLETRSQNSAEPNIKSTDASVRRATKKSAGQRSAPRLYLARNLIADGDDAAVSQLKHAHHFTWHDV